MPRKGIFKTAPADTRVRSSGMRMIDYHRFHLRRHNNLAEQFACAYLLADARRRSYMRQWFGNLPLTEGAAVLIGRRFRLRTPEPPPAKPWIEHVRDGVPLSAHGARLLGLALMEET